MVPTNTTPGNPQNSPAKVSAGSHSRFNGSYPVLGTHRFGEYTPHFLNETVDNDNNCELRSSHTLRSYTLKSPLLNNVKMHKDYFNVPLQAIIPFNYEKWKVNPVQGDDCPDDAGTGISEFFASARAFLNNHKPSTFTSSSADWLAFFRFLAASQWLFSEGSLLAACEGRIGNQLSITTIYNGAGSSFNTDDFVDLVFANMAGNLIGNFFQVTFGSVTYQVVPAVEPDHQDPQIISLRDFWMRFLQQPICSFTTTLDIASALDKFDFSSFSVAVPSYTRNITVDIRRLLAYQIVCAHFYSNDHIDYIYTAQLYRQNQWALATANPNISSTFLMNGVTYQYDALSAHIVKEILTYNSSTYSDQEFSYLANIFNFNRSLRFMDYFVGARSNPLAVGNTNIPVVGSNVSVIDVTKSIQRQRFLNAVNRAGARFESYMKNIFGKKPDYDYHNPFYIGSTVDDIHTVETDNTGNAQFEDVGGMETTKNSITSNFQSVAQRFAFNFSSDRDSILIGITYYDIPRYYPFGVPKIMQHLNRFDDFIPQAQFIGDQSINKIELGSNVDADGIFGYTNRYQEYKMRVPYCFGGIRHFLRSWSYLAQLGNYNAPISPDFIRSQQTELDKFYLSLSHYSLAGYFHFIVLNNNEFTSSRPMVKKPNIL